MPWEEWEQLKTEAAEKHAARMQLNHVPPDPGGTGTLVSNKSASSLAARSVVPQREHRRGALGRFQDPQPRDPPHAGCLTAGAHRDVHDSWERYVKRVSGRCGKLSSLLEKAGNDQLKTDEAVEAEIGNLKIASADTPAVGGQGRGR
ncbi:hypothetical protein [Streptomyces sp. NPDC059668]|uniref:hypothetical protein n=1 Tax=Streptomyces sp. NPDC059668 TaxID=3346900 RepID=UPI003699A3F4